MANKKTGEQSRLIAVLREGISVVQMALFKELKELLSSRYPEQDQITRSMLAGSITNEIFGTPNPEPKFVAFHHEHRAVIEQELLGLAANLPHLRRYITDALRIQALCDNQEGIGPDNTLLMAEKFGILVKDRTIPLPSSFMTLARDLGEQHQLIIAPVQISPEDDRSLPH
jgi:hypothetical protein